MKYYTEQDLQSIINEMQERVDTFTQSPSYVPIADRVETECEAGSIEEIVLLVVGEAERTEYVCTTIEPLHQKMKVQLLIDKLSENEVGEPADFNNRKVFDVTKKEEVDEFMSLLNKEIQTQISREESTNKDCVIA